MAVKAYWVCRQEAGFGVFWKCRDASNAMKGCVSERTGNKEAWEAFRAQRLAELAPAFFEHRSRVLEAKMQHYKALGEAQAAAGGAGAGAPAGR